MKKMKQMGLLGLAIAVSIPTIAKDDERTGVADSSRVYDIEEVVVVEQPKENVRLRQQPVASTSFSHLQLASLGSQDLRELSCYVPSFSMPQYGSRYTSSSYVRGIGSRINAPAIGVYVDGMPIQSKAGFNFHTYEVDRVDVLRGPQGTLYGMNTEGGLIRLFSKNPFAHQGTDVTLSAGKGFWRKAEVSHYRKLSDKVAFSLAGFYDGQNGFYNNQYSGNHADSFNEFGGKGRLMWKPNDRFTLDLMADYQYVNQNAFPYGLMITREMIDNATIASPYYKRKVETEEPNTDQQSHYQRNLFNTGLRLSYAGQDFDVSSVTSFQFLSDRMLMDIDYRPQDYMHMKQSQLQNSLVEELTVKSNNNSFWRWTFGGTASYQWLKTDADVYFGDAMNAMLSKNITTYAYDGMVTAISKRYMAQGMDEAAAMAAAKVMVAAAGGCNINMALAKIPGHFHTPTLNLGVFHESNIDITQHLMATLGLRYDYSRVEIDYQASAMATLAEDVMGTHVDASVSSLLSHAEKNSFKQLLPKIGLTYKFGATGSNVYAAFSKGYRAGGYNIQMFSDILQTELQGKAQSAAGELVIEHTEADYEKIRNTIAYEPETSYNYEIGSHLNLLGNQLQLDLAAYYMQVHGQQLSVMAGNYGFGRMMVNAGKSHSMGLELSARGAALDSRLCYAFGYGLTIAKFDEYADSLADGTRVDYAGKYVPYVPLHTLSASADYRIDVDQSQMLPTRGFAFKSVTLGLNLSAQGQTYWDEANSYKQKFYSVLGAHADVDLAVCHVNFWVRNLTDTRYNTFAVQSAATGTTFSFAQMGHPFQFGADVRFSF